MELVLIIAILGISFLILYFASSLEREHFLLRLLCIFMFLSLLIVAGKATLDDNCGIMLQNETTIGNVTSYAYGTECADYQNTTNLVFYKLLTTAISVIFAYIFVYFVWQVLLFKGIINPRKK